MDNIQAQQKEIETMSTALLTPLFTILIILKRTTQISDRQEDIINKQLEILKPFLGNKRTKRFQNILSKL